MFKFLRTCLFPPLLSSSSSPLPSSPLPSSPAHDTGSPTLQKVSGFSGEPALDLLTQPSSLQDFRGELPTSQRLPLAPPPFGEWVLWSATFGPCVMDAFIHSVFRLFCLS